MNVRIPAVGDATTAQSSRNFSPREMFQEVVPVLALVICALLGMFAWEHFPKVMEPMTIAAGVLAFIYLVSAVAVRLGPTPEALVAMSMTGRELRAVIADTQVH